MIEYMRRLKAYLSKCKQRLERYYEDYKKHRAEQVVLKGNGRVFAASGHAVFYLIDRVTDLLLPMLAIPALLGITLNPVVLIPVAIALGVFVILLTINETINYFERVNHTKEDIATIKQDDRELGDIDFIVANLYDEIEELERQLADLSTVNPLRSVIAQQVISVQKADNTTLKFFDKVLKAIHSTMMHGMKAIKDIKVKVHSLMDLKNFLEHLHELYGFVKLLLLSMALLPALPILLTLVVAKALFVSPVEELRKEVTQTRAKHPELLSKARDVLAVVTKEKELLELKVQMRQKANEETMTIQQLVLFTQQGLKLSEKEAVPQQGIMLKTPKGEAVVEFVKDFLVDNECVSCPDTSPLGSIKQVTEQPKGLAVVESAQDFLADDKSVSFTDISPLHSILTT